MERKITWSEIEDRGKFILLAFFLVFLINPINKFIDAYIPDGGIIQFTLGILGVLFVIWYFSFTKKKK